MIKIIISNPGHHFNNALSLLYECDKRGIPCELISFCAFRGFRTPELPSTFKDVKKTVFFNFLSELKSRGAIKASVNRSPSNRKSGFVKNVIWKLAIRVFLRLHTGKFDKVILFNDNAYPFDKIVDDLVYRGVDVSLIQEGIRFDVPIAENSTVRMYGSSQVDRIFCWGKHSEIYFAGIKSKRTKIVISGIPHLYQASQNTTEYINKRVLGVFTNPIEQFGYCSEKEKMLVFERFAYRIAPILKDLDIRLFFRAHPNEDLDAYIKVLTASSIDFEINEGGIFEAVERVNWGIVWASTVGIELLLKNRPIGQLPLVDGRYVFDYVSSGAAVPIDFDSIQESIECLISENGLSEKASKFLEDHVQLNFRPETLILDELTLSL